MTRRKLVSELNKAGCYEAGELADYAKGFLRLATLQRIELPQGGPTVVDLIYVHARFRFFFGRGGWRLQE